MKPSEELDRRRTGEHVGKKFTDYSLEELARETVGRKQHKLTIDSNQNTIDCAVPCSSRHYYY